jgi:hypothetical protein
MRMGVREYRDEHEAQIQKRGESADTVQGNAPHPSQVSPPPAPMRMGVREYRDEHEAQIQKRGESADTVQGNAPHPSQVSPPEKR